MSYYYTLLDMVMDSNAYLQYMPIIFGLRFEDIDKITNIYHSRALLIFFHIEK